MEREHHSPGQWGERQRGPIWIRVGTADKEEACNTNKVQMARGWKFPNSLRTRNRKAIDVERPEEVLVNDLPSKNRNNYPFEHAVNGYKGTLKCLFCEKIGSMEMKKPPES